MKVFLDAVPLGVAGQALVVGWLLGERVLRRSWAAWLPTVGVGGLWALVALVALQPGPPLLYAALTAFVLGFVLDSVWLSYLRWRTRT